MDNMIMLDKRVIGQVIETLKTLDVRGFDSMDKLVGIVMLLEQTMNPPKTENEDDNTNKGE